MKINQDLEQDLRNSVLIMTKIKNDRYAQNLYASMCNMQWQKHEVWPLLKGDLWSCSWRYAGGIIADLRGEGDYLDWYCSGIGGVGALAESADETNDRIRSNGFVSEGTVTDEIRTDLAILGWHPVPWND